MLSVPPRTTDFSRAMQDAGPVQHQALTTAIGCLHRSMHKARVAPTFKAAKPATCAGMARPGRASHCVQELVVCASSFVGKGDARCRARAAQSSEHSQCVPGEDRCLQRCETGARLWGLHSAVYFIRRRLCFSHDVGRPCRFHLREVVLGMYRFMGKPWDVGQGRGLLQLKCCVVLCCWQSLFH
jgi:hypothetical protein